MDIKASVIYEDQEIVICNKEAGWLSQSDRTFAVDMVSALKTYRIQKGEEPYIAILNRLDCPVSGLVLFAKNPVKAAQLSKELQQQHINKYYYAVICGKLDEKRGSLVDYLVKDGKTNQSRVTMDSKLGKRAELEYEVVAEHCHDEETLSLVKIHLKTGRHHQIRVQFSSRKVPLYGDAKYNQNAKRGETIGLCAYQLEVSGRVFQIVPKGGIFSEFANEVEKLDTH